VPDEDPIIWLKYGAQVTFTLYEYNIYQYLLSLLKDDCNINTLGRRLTTDFRSDLTGRKSIWSYVGHVYLIKHYF
jgi:hypothetical protein